MINLSWFRHDPAYRNRIRIQWNTVRSNMRLKKMKTFNKSDLITWANRDKAKLCELYYFSNSVEGIQRSLEENSSALPLTNINDSDIANTFECQKDEFTFSYACILPMDKVIEKEPEKKYRACKSIKELCELIFRIARNPELYSIKYKSEEQCIYDLLSDGYIIHLKNKSTGREYYSKIANIVKDEEDHILFTAAGYSLLDLFNTFDIEINGEWKPFGVLDED